MAENKYFRKALADFAFDMASGGAIRHLAENGYTVKQIVKELDFDVPMEKVRQAVWDHFVENGTLLLEEPGTGTPKGRTVFVEERGKFGKTSFRRVVIPGEDGRQIHWRETVFAAVPNRDFRKFLSEKCRKNGRDTAYMSCDFGVLEGEEPGKYLRWMEALEERQREYLEGLPWGRQRVYHRMDRRMEEIAGRLFLTGEYSGCFYFMELGEKVVL